VTRPAPRGAARFVAVATLALVVATISGLETATAAGADAPRPAAALFPDDAVHGIPAVGVRPPPAPAVGRATSIPNVRSVTLAVAAAAVGLASVGACRWSCRRADDRFAAPGLPAWAAPCGRRAPPLAHAA
jgi:hypothetical protein